MASAIVKHLEEEMATAFEAGDDHVFTVARNRREAYWRFRDGTMSLETAKKVMTKIPKGSREAVAKVLLDWNGALDPSDVVR
tara:strand:+ start:292 stop:537 length:246 start_codon:yes stop_codon:yes gene_type:complete